MLAALQLTVGFLLTIFIIVGVHEYGHYLAARCFSLKILRFSIGLGKPLLRRLDRHGTEWVLAPWPIGGYLQMVQTVEEASSLKLEPSQSFNGIARWQRSIIVAAGPMANFALAAVLFFAAALYGTEGLRARVGDVIADTPAARAGFAPGHDIVAIDDREVVLWSEAYERMFTSVAHRDIAVGVADPGGGRLDLQLALSQLPPSVLEGGDVLEKVGLRPDESYLSVVLNTVVEDSPAAAAGLAPDDAIVAINGVKTTTWRAIVEAIEANAGQPMQIIVLRGEQQLEIEATPRLHEEGGRSVGKLGVAPKIDRERLESLLAHRRASIGEALESALHRTGEAVLLTYRFIGNLLSTQISIESVSGPIGIANYAGRAFDIGLYAFLVFLAHISISLGALNLLPIPVLDGGYLLQFAVEGVMRRDFSQTFLHAARALGIFCLILIMGVAIYNDVS